MCDTVVVTGEATADGRTLFGKNSDREPNEAHQLLRVPAADHTAGSLLRCTYIDVPQVDHTYGVLLAKPFWIWGAEMGANECGLVIGNEAVFTRVPYEATGLLGMDLLRLALERAATARQAVEVIAGLLSEYGQGGNHGLFHSFSYHSSFLMADPDEAWLLETAGRHWAARQVRGVYAISNALTIEDAWDLASADLVGHAIRQGWCAGSDDFSFAACYSEPEETDLYDGRIRCARASDILLSHAGRISINTLLEVLRDHGASGKDGWSIDGDAMDLSICMHAGQGEKRGSQTTGSMISHLDPERETHFFTGTAAPCTSIFKPVWVDAKLQDMGPAPEKWFDTDSLFWRHELLHRRTLLEYPRSIALYGEERDRLEQEFISQALTNSGLPSTDRAAFCARCFADAEAAEARWLEMLSGESPREDPNPAYQEAWDEFNKQAMMPD